MNRVNHPPATLAKTPTGIRGLDAITEGGLPKGRPTLICGTAGCGKTLTAMEFLVHGALQFKEPGVFVAFEENEQELAENVASLGFNLPQLVKRKTLLLDYIRVERSEIHETGEYDLEGLFVRLGHAIDSIGAKRVVLDTIEALFGGFPNEAILRAELRRLFRWLKDRGVTAIITGERGDKTLTRYGLEEYVADCVILLDHRVINQVSTRRLRIVKYRGSFHGTNEYPFLISPTGISVLPITSLGLDFPAPTQRVSSGLERLDTMLGGQGYFRGSTVLVSGTAGTGKTSLAAAFALAACRHGEQVLYLAFEESPAQIKRNMRSIGLNLAAWEKRGSLHFHATRPNQSGLETHLLAIHELIRQLNPDIVIIDPITNLIAVGDKLEVRLMLTRLIDFLKRHQITSLFTSLTETGSAADQSEVGISSLIDTWVALRNVEHAGERNRALHILKSRGMGHSNQVREFLLTSHGIELTDVYVGGGEVLTGTARLVQEVQAKDEIRHRQNDLNRLRRALQRKRQVTAAQMASLKADAEADMDELTRTIEHAQAHIATLADERQAIGRKRMADPDEADARLRARPRNASTKPS